MAPRATPDKEGSALCLPSTRPLAKLPRPRKTVTIQLVRKVLSRRKYYNAMMNTKRLPQRVPIRWLIFLLPPLAGCSGHDPVGYSTDIEPLLHQSCLRCHTFEKPGVAEGEFSVDSYVTVLQGGKSGPVINLQDPESSKLPTIMLGQIAMYEHDGDHHVLMNQHQRDRLREWVQRGLYSD